LEVLSLKVIEWLLANWTGLLAVLFTFGFMIFVHELGHFLMAKRVGITVHEFALGFGPKLLSFGGSRKRKKDEEERLKEYVKDENENSESPDLKKEPITKEPVKTEYCLRMIPVGGFVSMEGEDEPGDRDDPGNFNNKTVWGRMKVILAGCTMNYITGILIFLLIGFAWGIPVIADAENPPAVIGTLNEGYPAAEAGLQPGDRIVEINGEEIKDFKHLKSIISPIKDGREVSVTVDRKGKNLTYNVKVVYNSEFDSGLLGFSPSISILNLDFEKKTAGEVVSTSLNTTWRLTIAPITIVRMIIDKQLSLQQVGSGTAGPIGISQMLFEISKKGIPSLLYMMAMLSILIGAFNLLPIPALDGSRAVFLGVEGVRGKPLDPEKEGMIHQIGFVALMILMFVVAMNDIIRLIRGENIFR
jgi:regulator of sigma E protease